MTGWTPAFVFAFVAFLGAFAAGIAPRYLPMTKTRYWPATTAIAAGLLLASAMVIVIPEGFEVLFLSHEAGAVPHSDRFLGLPPVLASGLAILGGFMLMLGLEARGISHEIDEHQQTVRLLSLGLGIHAMTDGLALGASVATNLMAITLPILAAVTIHKLPVAFGLGTFLWSERNTGGRPMRSLLAFSLATPAGLILTFLFLRHLSHEWIGLMLLFSGGTFLYVAAVDVLGRIRKEQTATELFRWISIGVALVILALIGFQLLGLEAEFHG